MPAMTRVLKALSNPNRRKVYQIICRQGRGRSLGLAIGRVGRLTPVTVSA